MNIIILYLKPTGIVPNWFNFSDNFVLPFTDVQGKYLIHYLVFNEQNEPMVDKLKEKISPLISDNETIIFYHTGSNLDYTNFMKVNYQESETLHLIPFSDNKGPVYDILNSGGILLQKLKKRDDLALWEKEFFSHLQMLIIYASKGKEYNETFNTALSDLAKFNQNHEES